MPVSIDYVISRIDKSIDAHITYIDLLLEKGEVAINGDREIYFPDWDTGGYLEGVSLPPFPNEFQKQNLCAYYVNQGWETIKFDSTLSWVHGDRLLPDTFTLVVPENKMEATEVYPSPTSKEFGLMTPSEIMNAAYPLVHAATFLAVAWNDHNHRDWNHYIKEAVSKVGLKRGHVDQANDFLGAYVQAQVEAERLEEE